MKKLVTSIMASAMILGVSSCVDHNFEAPISTQQKMEEAFEDAFIKKFGLVHPDQNWGFGVSTETKATRATRAEEEDGHYKFNTTQVEDSTSNYKTALPDQKENLQEVSNYSNFVKSYQKEDGNWANKLNNSVFYVDENTHVINCYAGLCELYFPAGTYTITSWATSFNTKIYLLPGANVTLSNDLAEEYNNLWSVASTAFLTINGEIKGAFQLHNKGTVKATALTIHTSTNGAGDGKVFNYGKIYINGDITPGSFLYNYGDIEAVNYSAYENGYCLNVGKMILSGNLRVNNANTEFVNLSENLVCKDVEVVGSAHLLNLGTINASGTTSVSSNNNSWVNEGTYVTDNFVYVGGSTDVRNGCKLFVNNMFSMILGDTNCNGFEVSAGGSVETKDFAIGIGYLKLGSNSLFKVKGNAYMGITQFNYGIYGVGETYAVFQAKDAIRCRVFNYSGTEIKVETASWIHSHSHVNYGGNLYVDTETHFENGYIDAPTNSQPIYGVGEKVLMFIGKNKAAPIYIPRSSCNPGYGTESTPPDTIPQNPTPPRLLTYRVYAEDLVAETYGDGKSDWDFNDVVFDVVYDRNEDVSWVVIQAAGGTLPLYLTVGSQTVEVHAALYNNPDAPTNVMINTRNPNSCEKEPVVVFDNTPGRLDPGDVEIQVKLSEENTITVPTYPGHPSAKFAVDITNYPGVKWAVEIQPIWTVFTNFKEWVNTNQALEFNLPND